MFKIEKDVPMEPKTKKSNSNPLNLPFEDMEIGDSFVISLSDTSVKSIPTLRTKIKNNLTAMQKEGKLATSYKITTRVLEDDKGAMRIWREF